MKFKNWSQNKEKQGAMGVNACKMRWIGWSGMYCVYKKSRSCKMTIEYKSGHQIVRRIKLSRESASATFATFLALRNGTVTVRAKVDSAKCQQ